MADLVPFTGLSVAKAKAAAETAVTPVEQAVAEATVGAVAKAEAQGLAMYEGLAEAEENSRRMNLIEAAQAVAQVLSATAAEIVVNGEVDDGLKAQLLEAISDARKGMAEFELDAEVEVVKTPMGTPMQGSTPSFRNKIARIRKSYERLPEVIAVATNAPVTAIGVEDIADFVRDRMRHTDSTASRVRASLLKKWEDEAKARRNKWHGSIGKVRTKELLIECWGPRCMGCGWDARWPNGDVRKSMLEVEHLDARKNGGGDELTNCGLSCKECNLAKGEKLTMHELRQANARKGHLYCALSVLPDLDEMKAWAIDEEAAATGV